MFRNGQSCVVRNNIAFYLLNTKDFSKFSIVMASSTESLTSAKSHLCRTFCFGAQVSLFKQ